MTDVAIIGAGPYGLSLAAHLAASRISFRIFGKPMSTWLHQMPEGMHLKSEGFASTLYDPEGQFTLRQYCQQAGLAYADVAFPVPLSTFTSYGLEFQRRMVPNLEQQNVVSLRRDRQAFWLRLEDGTEVRARKVVVAVGISHFAYLPPELRGLPRELVTHASQHNVLTSFNGRDVVVIGAGSSAADVAGLLHEAGAEVRLVGRKPAIRFHDPLRLPRPWRDRVMAPMNGLGPGWRSWWCTKAPLLFRLFPEKFRLEVVRRHLGPAPGWAIRRKVEGIVPLHLGHSVHGAEVVGDRIRLHLTGPAGEKVSMTAEHVIAGTGYRADLRRLSFLESALLSEISSVQHTPILSSRFESSVPNLYFVGATSANTFGPLVRFAYGAGFTARRLSRHLIARAEKTRKLMTVPVGKESAAIEMAGEIEAERVA